MKVGDLVKLRPSVLHNTADLDLRDRFGHSQPDDEQLGVIIDKHHNAVKVHWFGGGTALPSKSQYVLKLVVVSEL